MRDVESQVQCPVVDHVVDDGSDTWAGGVGCNAYVRGKQEDRVVLPGKGKYGEEVDREEE